MFSRRLKKKNSSRFTFWIWLKKQPTLDVLKAIKKNKKPLINQDGQHEKEAGDKNWARWVETPQDGAQYCRA